jgi:signal transduction histidine kinase
VVDAAERIVQLEHGLNEALAQQTATADVLKVISRSTFDLQTVLDTLLESAVRLCEARRGALFRLEGNLLHVAAQHGFDDRRRKLLAAMYPMAPNRGHMSGRAVLAGAAIQIPDILADDEYRGENAKEAGLRSLLGVPLLRNGQAIGSIVIFRTEAGPFTDKQLELIQTFADQAVIAIENTRLLSELRESLQQQTATADVLKVISSSSGELKPVFQSMLEQATRICDAKFGIVFRYDGRLFHPVASLDLPPALANFMVKQGAFPPQPGQLFGRLCESKTVISVVDRASDPSPSPSFKYGAARSSIAVPMLKDDELVGALFIYRTEVLPFTDKQIELVKNFAAQSVIAIENARLLSELRESLQQQTATAEVLKVISASPSELETVFHAMLENAVRFCEAKFAQLFLYDQNANHFRVAGTLDLPPAWAEYLGENPVPASPRVPLGRAATAKQPIHIKDITKDEAYIEGFAPLVKLAELGGARTLLVMPMLKEKALVGAIGIYRQEVRPFAEKQIELVQNFAAQGVIAIENARLLNELRSRTHELAASLDNLRATQDRLVQTQKLASLGQLTAGIAHEIKNPLNFVNNFSGLSAELIDELHEALKDTNSSDSRRSEIADLMDTLRSNLDKVVQHGQRADAIVKNMLMHSHQGSGEHRRVAINALVEESLKLAYHGARAEKNNFNVMVEQCFDPDAGEADIFPKEVTRVLLNLISNGVYATRNKTPPNGEIYSPTITASTKSLDDRVEIRIRDNGIGMPADVKEKMFNPFFTTKPAGEGTGLGLSISHDIIVKQHGGLIEVDTEPGKFTEVRIVLPRVAAHL